MSGQESVVSRGRVLGRYFGRAAIVSLSSLLPNVRTFVVLLIIGVGYSTQVRSAVGVTGTLYGLVFVLGIGFSIHTVHRASRAIKSLGSTERALRPIRFIVGRELTVALAASLIILVISIAMLIFVPTLTNLEPSVFRLYWLCYFPGIALIPITLVISGAFQTVHRDYSNLVAASISTATQTVLALVAVLVHLPAEQLVVVLGLSSSGAAVFGVVFRLSNLRRLGIDTRGLLRSAFRGLADAPVRRVRQLPPRLAGSIDGLIFMGTFTLASFVAVTHAPEDGAIVTLAVALMRALVVPMKQFGIVGGRIVAQGGRGGAGVLTQRDVLTVCAAVLTGLAVVVLALRVLLPQLGSLPWLVVALMAAQLVLEPFSGIFYSLLKIVESPKAGLPALFVSYLAVGIPGLIAIGLVGAGTAEVIWIWLFGVRALFTAGVIGVGLRAGHQRELRSLSSSQHLPSA